MEYSNKLAAGTILSAADSWFMGANIPGKKRAVLLYANSAREYRKKEVTEVAASGYEGFVLR